VGACGTATAVVADVADPAQVQAVADRALHVYGRLDTWVHMAGVLLVARFEDTTAEEFARVLQVNLLGQVHRTCAAAGGAFISMSSMGSQRGIPLQSAYCSSKHGRGPRYPTAPLCDRCATYVRNEAGILGWCEAGHHYGRSLQTCPRHRIRFVALSTTIRSRRR